MNVAALARAEISALQPYVTASQSDATVRLNANEVSRPVLPALAGTALNRYPCVRPDALRRRLAGIYDVAEASLLATRGSSEAIDLLIRTFCRPYTDNIVTASPSFAMYRVYADVQGAAVVEVPLAAEDNFAMRAEALSRACDGASKLVFICSPNNPTGNTMEIAELEALLEARAGRSLVVVDEAYVEFSRQGSVLALIERYPHLAVLRTLSKAWGLAGARCGVVIASAAVIELLARLLPPYAFSSPTSDCLLHALDEHAGSAMQILVREVIAERARVAAALQRLACVKTTWPSEANFLLVRFADLEAVQRRVASAGILIRAYDGYPALANCARITIGSTAENDRLLAALAGATP